ncbi:hypothetical protein B296_00016532 [Ensete ventricosum]|uniref:Uncharacterized protein n=1 Tax=Ensete ventricosum TaxID=4639 RepID=A0A427AFX7_ENSVE|nr:hypothetical protein B296_00016532 [Ensete ventricosum]
MRSTVAYATSDRWMRAERVRVFFLVNGCFYASEFDKFYVSIIFLFIVYMNKFELTLLELLNMLREVESTIKKEKPVLYNGETKKKMNASKTLKKGKGK